MRKVLSFGKMLEMSLGQKFLTRVAGQVSYIRIWKISPKNPKFFIFFPYWSKKIHWVRSKNTLLKDRLASYLLWVKVC